jgi:SAM-dependent methyltransferase
VSQGEVEWLDPAFADRAQVVEGRVESVAQMPKGASGGSVTRSLTSRYVDGTYQQEVKGWHISDSPWKAARVLQMLDKNGIRPSSVTDLGCGVGQVLVEMQRRMGADVVFRGYDISPQAVEIARRNAGDRLTFVKKDFLLSDVDPPDVLLVLDVFEHVPDYLGFLLSLNKRAKWFVFHIPLDLSVQSLWRGSYRVVAKRRKYGHLHAFTREMAVETLCDTGYEVVDHVYTNDHEIDNSPPRGLRPRLMYELRRQLFRQWPDFAVFMFASFNLLVLAKSRVAGTAD